MKVVLSGGTGWIGGEVVRQCLDHPSITSVVLLLRRDPSGAVAENPKAKVIILKDFTSYDEATIKELQTADAAIWCLGTFTGNEKVDIEYPLKFINTIKARPSQSTQFRYVQLGGAFTEPPPKEGEKERTLWYFPNGRRVRGAVEARVLGASEEGPESKFVVYLVKPGGVAAKDGIVSNIEKCLMGDTLGIRVHELAATMVDLALQGNEQKVFRNREIISHAKKVLERSN